MSERFDHAVVVFYNTDFRLLLILLDSQNRKKEYWLSESPAFILNDFITYVQTIGAELQSVFIQDPTTIAEIAPAYHSYHRFNPIPSDLLQRKTSKAKAFLRAAVTRIPKDLSGCIVEVSPATIEDFIIQHDTKEKIPPHGADLATQTEIAKNYNVGPITCETDGRDIPCPICWHDSFLRGWSVPDHTFALCYNCGTTFFCDNGQVIQEFAGDRREWGARAIALAAWFQTHLKEHKLL